MMIITSNLVLKMGGEEKYYNNLKQQQQQQNRKKLIEKFSTLFWRLSTMITHFDFFFACEWESQIVESVIVVFLRSQLKLN